MIEHLATRIDGGCSLEAVTLAQDRVDDVYLDGAGSLRDSRSFPVTPDRRTSDAPRPTAWSSPSVTNSADLPRSRSRRIQAAVPVPPAASPATASQRDSRAVHAENATVILNSLPAKPGTRKPANPSASRWPATSRLRIARAVTHADTVAATATVLKVVDGDTVDIVDDVRGRLRIRVLGAYASACWA